MANFRPAGFSDEDSDSDEYGFYEKPTKRYYPVQNDAKKKVEIALQDAIMNANTEAVRKIIQNDLQKNANFRLESGWTPLMHACFHAQDTIVKLLLELGADPNIHSDSLTPIMTACSNSSANNDTMYNIITDLIEYGCILNTGDKYGQTPLMRAISSGRVAVVQKLLENDVNIEMRDQQGWTALFWSVHHNQPEILEMLIDKGARITEVDRSNRKPIDIANAHDFTNIVEILNKFLKIDEDTDTARPYNINNQLRSWHDYYPGLKKGDKITYQSEIPNLLYGMNCEHLIPLIENSEMDLRTFLLLQEKDMIEIGVDMPFERKRLKAGLRNFHMRSWKLNSVAGLYARKMENYSVLDCLTTLGTHLQQLYVLEATLQYTLREYNRVQNQLKFEPPDSPLLVKIKESPRKIIMNINNVRRQIKNMKQVLIKINKSNPQQANLIKEKTFKDVALSYTTEIIMLCSVGLLVYQFRNVIANQIRH